MARPTRRFGLFTATALVVANMIGTGVFTTSGFLLAELHSPGMVVLAWVTGGLIAMLGAACYGALARAIPESGGEYVFLARTLHPAAGYVAGWLSLLVGFSAPIAAAGFAFGEYLKPVFPSVPAQVSGSVLVILCTMAHAWHVQGGAWIQNAAVAVKVLLLGGFILLAGANLQPSESGVEASEFSVAAFAVSLVWISFSYAGWNAVVYLGGEVRDGGRTLPRSMLLGTAVVTMLYVALNAIFVYSAPVAELAGRLEVARVAAEFAGGEKWANAVTAFIVLALVTSVSAMIMAGPRVYARMAEDGYLPRWIGATGGGPQGAVILQLVLALVFLWSAAYKALLTYIGFTLSLSTAATVLGLMLLKQREGERLRVAGWPLVPILFLGFTMFSAVFAMQREPRATVLGLVTIAAGLAMWKVQARR